MDALPMLEETGAEYASQNNRVMHACDHNGHTAIGLTVAKILNSHQRAELALSRGADCPIGRIEVEIDGMTSRTQHLMLGGVLGYL